jgi:hypothetical protein
MVVIREFKSCVGFSLLGPDMELSDDLGPWAAGDTEESTLASHPRKFFPQPPTWTSNLLPLFFSHSCHCFSFSFSFFSFSFCYSDRWLVMKLQEFELDHLPKGILSGSLYLTLLENLIRKKSYLEYSR